MFAGEGDPFRTNRRFKLLSARASRDPAVDRVRLGDALRPRPRPAPRHLRQGRHLRRLGRDARRHEGALRRLRPGRPDDLRVDDDQRPGADRARVLPQHRDRPAGRRVPWTRRAASPDEAEHAELAAYALANVRGTVQADILKEDQGQNTCLFSTEFSLRMMADIQEWFIEQQVRNFYSVSISGYHIAEAGANPISQLAFTLANGFTYVEAYLARGMDIDDFAPNLSFFFSNGMDPEYSVLGRVARRIWAVAMKEKYGANERSQKLKYHVQTSRPVAARAGDGLQRHPHHAAGADRDLRQRQLPAHQRLRRGRHHPDRGVGAPGAGDPADHQPRVGPGDEREPAPGLVHHRRAHRPRRGGRAARSSTRINERGGVLGAMETGYQRGRIQDESMLYEHRKHDGSLPIIGVNTFRQARRPTTSPARRSSWPARPRRRSSRSCAACGSSRPPTPPEAAGRDRPAQGGGRLGRERLRRAHGRRPGLLAQQVTEAFFEVGGQYRRNV